MVGLFVGLTQWWVVLSEPDVHPWCGASRAGPGRGVDGADGAIQPLATLLFELLVQRARWVSLSGHQPAMLSSVWHGVSALV